MRRLTRAAALTLAASGVAVVLVAPGSGIALAQAQTAAQVQARTPEARTPARTGLPPSARPRGTDDLSDYQRFVIYPRLEKGIEEQRRGSHAAAIAQFERARQLAPQSVLTALYLAYAYRQASDRAAATPVLEDQRQHTPDQPQLAAALAEDAPWRPPPMSDEEVARQQRAEQDARLARLDQSRRQALEDAIAAVRLRIAAGELVEAADLAVRTLPGDAAIHAVLDRDLAQRAIHLRRWPMAQAAFERIDRAGRLTSGDARQWLQIRLSTGDTVGARHLLARPEFQGPENRLALARVLLGRAEHEALRELISGPWPRFATAAQEAEWLQLSAGVAAEDAETITRHPLRFAGNRDLQATLVLPGLLARERFDEADRVLAGMPAEAWKIQRLNLASARSDSGGVLALGRELVSQRPGDLGILDQVTFQLVRLGASGPAADLLLDAWPFAPVAVPADVPAGADVNAIDADDAADDADSLARKLRPLLIDRLIGLVERDPSLVPAQRRSALARPLPAPDLRERQAMLFTALDDCHSIRRVLGDFSADYGAASWIRLGQCYRDGVPGLAQFAYGKALALEPDSRNRIALAYQAFATEDFATANEAWSGLDSKNLGAAELLAAAAAAAGAGDYAGLRRWLDRYDEAGFDEKDDRYWWWRARLAGRSQPDRALAAVRRAIEIRPQAGYYQLEAELLGRAGDPAGALAAIQKALALSPDNPSLLESLAVAHAEAGDPDTAARILQRVDVAQPDNPAIAEQLAYLHLRLGQATAARDRTRAVIDEFGRYPTARLDDARREQLYGFRRLHESLGRRWTFSADAWVGNRLSYAGRSAEPGQAYRSFSQIELDYRLATQSGSGDAALSLFGRVLASGDSNGIWPLHQPTLGVGLRYKPLVDQVMFLTVEPLIPIGDRADRRTDLLVRASASLLNDGRHSDDWHPLGSGWFARSLYLDLAHYLRDERTAFTADLRGSYHWKLAEGRSLEPYTHVQYTGVRHAALDRFDKDIRAGVGLRLNQWSGGSVHDAYPTRTSVGIEYQHAFRSFLDERDVVLATLRGRW